MKRSTFIPLVTLLASSACMHARGNADPETRPADDTPTAFVTEDGVAPVQECRSPLIDPRDQTRLRLIRSATIGTLYRGDYQTPAGKYGVAENELLRIDCESGQVIGIVRS